MDGEVLAAVITAVVGPLLFWWLKRGKSNRREYGLKITSPGNGTSVVEDLEVTGTFETLPPRSSLYVVVATGHLFRPQVSRQIEFDHVRKVWRGHARIEQDSRILVVTTGPDGQALFEYFKSISASSGDAAPLQDLPSDVRIHDEVAVRPRVIEATAETRTILSGEPLLLTDGNTAVSDPAPGLFDQLRQATPVRARTPKQRVSNTAQPAASNPTHVLSDEEVFEGVFGGIARNDDGRHLFASLESLLITHKRGSFSSNVGFLRFVRDNLKKGRSSSGRGSIAGVLDSLMQEYFSDSR